MILSSFGSRKTRDIHSAVSSVLASLEHMSSDKDPAKFAPQGARVPSLPTTIPGQGQMEAGAKKSPASPTPTKEATNVLAGIPQSPQEVIQHFKPNTESSTSATALRLPDKIMAILLREEAPDAIWWLQKGTAFAMQKEKFQDMILDKHFRGNKFKSLVRNLHRWGFKRMTCDTSPQGKTIAFSHKCFRKDKPELVKLIQITKEKDSSDKLKESRMQAFPTMPPDGLKFPSPSSGPLREERGLGNAGLSRSSSISSAQQQRNPTLASMVAAEHHHNLTSHGPESLYQSLSAHSSDVGHLSSLLGGNSSTSEQAALFSRMGVAQKDNREQTRPGGLLGASQDRHRLGPGLLQSQGSSYEAALQSAALDQQRREAALQQQLAASFPADTQARLLLQQRLLGGRAGGIPTSPTIFRNHHSTQALLPNSNVNSHFLSQLTNAAGPPMAALQGNWGLENSLLLARQNQGSRHPQQEGGTSSTAGLSPDQLLYLAELRRRSS